MLFTIGKILIKEGRKMRKAFIIPWIGIIIGTLMLLIVDMIMDGMENEIFKSVNFFENGYRIENVNDFDNVLIFLEKNKIKHELSYSREVLISHGENYHISKMNVKILNEENKLIIGEGVKRKLNLEIGDSVSIFSPLDVSLSTMKIPYKNLSVDSIYSIPVVDFDLNNIFVNLSSEELDINFDKSIHILSPLTPNQINLISTNLDGAKLIYWKDKYNSLISAIKLEKNMYLAFAYILVLISSLGLFTVLNFVLTNKLKGFSVIHSLGVPLIRIQNSLLLILISMNLFSCLIALSITFLSIHYNLLTPIVNNLFPIELFYNFDLEIDIYYFFFILGINLFIVVLSALLPIRAIKESKTFLLKREL